MGIVYVVAPSFIGLSYSILFLSIFGALYVRPLFFCGAIGMATTSAQKIIPKEVAWSDIMTEKMAKFFEKEHVQFAIRNKILDPILNYILNKIFPYVMLICVMFMLLLISVIVTLCVMIFKFRTNTVIPLVKVVGKETDD